MHTLLGCGLTQEGVTRRAVRMRQTAGQGVNARGRTIGLFGQPTAPWLSFVMHEPTNITDQENGTVPLTVIRGHASHDQAETGSGDSPLSACRPHFIQTNSSVEIPVDRSIDVKGMRMPPQWQHCIGSRRLILLSIPYSVHEEEVNLPTRENPRP